MPPKDLISVGVSLLIGIITGIWVVYAHFEQTADERRNQIDRANQQIALAIFESKRPFYQRQLDYFGNAARAAAEVATLPDGDKREAAKASFWQLYWGELGIVEQGEFAGAMVSFGDALREQKDGQPSVVTRGGLTGLAYAIAKAARTEAADAWRVELPPEKAHR